MAVQKHAAAEGAGSQLGAARGGRAQASIAEQETTATGRRRWEATVNGNKEITKLVT